MQFTRWEDLRLRLVSVTSRRGVKASLAKDFKVSHAAVSQWLSGASVPTADNALALQKWVEDLPRKKNKTARNAMNIAHGHKTRFRLSNNENSKQVRRKSSHTSR